MLPATIKQALALNWLPPDSVPLSRHRPAHKLWPMRGLFLLDVYVPTLSCPAVTNATSSGWTARASSRFRWPQISKLTLLSMEPSTMQLFVVPMYRWPSDLLAMVLIKAIKVVTDLIKKTNFEIARRRWVLRSLSPSQCDQIGRLFIFLVTNLLTSKFSRLF